MEHQYVTFCLDSEEYAIEIQRIKEIVGYRHFTRIPGFRNIVKGMINLRGIILPVFDLRLKLNLPPREYNNFSVIFVTEVLGRILGLLVDKTSDVISLSPQEIIPTPKLQRSLRTEYIKAIAQRDERLIAILDLERAFNEKELDELAIPA